MLEVIRTCEQHSGTARLDHPAGKSWEINRDTPWKQERSEEALMLCTFLQLRWLARHRLGGHLLCIIPREASDTDQRLQCT